MALKVTHLNADSTFLLSFAPSEAETATAGGIGHFSVLVDPWLRGDSTIFHRKFALARHTVPSYIQHLSEIPAPNVVIISQDRTDHCHETTLRQLDPELPHTIIFAHPAAAKKIHGWKYFKPSKVVPFPTYNDRKSDTVIRFRIPSASPELQPGEVTLAFVPTKFDITKLHNGIGITYRPPMPPQDLPAPVSPVTVTSLGPNSKVAPSTALMPPTPPESPTLTQSFCESPTTPTLEAPSPPKGAFNKLRSRSHGALRAAAAAQNNPSKSTTDLSIPPLPPLSACSTNTQPPLPYSPAGSLISTRTASTAATSRTTSTTSSVHRPRTLSVIYAPHGVSYAAIRHYAASHLIHHSALPLTLLLHSWDRVQNAWYLGGNIISGVPGGLDIAKNLLAQCWISAHDEDKESSGLAVIRCTVSKYSAADVKRLLAAPEEGGGMSRTSTNGSSEKDLSLKPSAARPASRKGSATSPAALSDGTFQPHPRPTPATPTERAQAAGRGRLAPTDVRQMACGESAILTAG